MTSRKRDYPHMSYSAALDAFDNCASNPSAAQPIQEVIRARISRRDALKGMAALGAMGVLGSMGVRSAKAATSTLGFTEIPRTIQQQHAVAPGYSADVLIRWGDAVVGSAPAFDPADQSAEAQDQQFGYNCDYIGFLPLPAGSNNSSHGLLCVNHEYTIPHLMFPNHAEDAEESAGQVAIEMAAHGHSVIEVRKFGGKWRVVENSPYARRISVNTPMTLTGPAAGDSRLKTSADATGTRVIGTVNNCAGGHTPWGTVVFAEENFHGYFGGETASPVDADLHKRYGISANAWYDWYKHEKRFDLGAERNEINRFGWMVEYDPYDPSSTPIKRTALGRFKHEGATVAVNGDGRLMVYMGDDERFDYLYKFITDGRFDANNRSANRDLLDAGTLYVAKFSDDGTMTWMPLVYGSGPLTAANGFTSQADVLIETRRAADLLGATPMDRPEDVEPNPVNGKVYLALTNNTRRNDNQVDAANPRANNAFGHVLELVPPGSNGNRDHGALVHEWNIFLLAGDPRDPAQGAKYHPEVSEHGWLAAPDNVAIDPKGHLWISTDQGSSQAKNQLADGMLATDTEGAGRALTKRFFNCPPDAEMCGPEFTPDGTTLFVAVQHPGEADGSSYASPSTRWPDFQPNMPPRPSVVAITKNGGGDIGS